MAMLQQLQHEVQSLKKDVERLQGGSVQHQVLAEKSTLPVPAVQGSILPAPQIGENKIEEHMPVEEITVEADYIEGEERQDEDFSIPNATDALIRRALQRFPNKKDAADALGISERTLYRKIKELHLED